MLATGVGNTVVSPVGVPPAGGGGGATVVPAVVVALDVVELVLVLVAAVVFVVVVFIVVAVVAPAPWIHCEYHSLEAVQTHPLGQTLGPVQPLPPPVGVSWGFCENHGISLTLAVWGGRALGADGERAEGDEDHGGEGMHRGLVCCVVD